MYFELPMCGLSSNKLFASSCHFHKAKNCEKRTEYDLMKINYKFIMHKTHDKLQICIKKKSKQNKNFKWKNGRVNKNQSG